MSSESDLLEDTGPTLDDICKPVPQIRTEDEEAEFQRALMADLERLYRMNGSGELNEFDGQHVAMVDGKILGSGRNPCQLAKRLGREYGIPEDRIAMMAIGGTPIIHFWGS